MREKRLEKTERREREEKVWCRCVSDLSPVRVSEGSDLERGGRHSLLCSSLAPSYWSSAGQVTVQLP